MKEEKKKETEEKRELTEEENEALKELEKELIKALEEEQKSNDNPLVLFFNMALHKNFFVHTVLMLLTNLFSLIAVMGITSYGKVTDIGFFFGAVFLFTFLEMILKIVVLRFFYKSVIKSFGTFNLIYLIPLYYLIIVKVGHIDFNYLWQNFIVLVCFLVLRLFLSHYIKKVSYRR